MGLASVVEPSAAALPVEADECTVIRDSDIAFPKTDSVQQVLSGYQASPDHMIVGFPTPPTHYRTYAALVVEFDESGKATQASFSHSTGNRAVDRALIAWARGITLPKSSCSVRRILAPVDLRERRDES